MPNASPVLENALVVRPDSGLSFGWCEYFPEGAKIGSSDTSLGPEGCTATMLMLIHWSDITDAVQQLLGYSYRDVGQDPHVLRRVLPWRHPSYSQLWVKSISSVRGVQLSGILTASTVQVGGGAVLRAGGGGGIVVEDNPAGSVSNYTYALLTLHFWRPPYAVRSDSSIINGAGFQREWLRFVDRHWTLETQMLSRESQGFVWVDSHPGGTPGSVGQPMAKLGIKRRWYQVPEDALFTPIDDGTPNGIPNNLIYAGTTTTNPVTGYVRSGGYANSQATGQVILSCVNSPIGGGTDDSNASSRFFGCRMGTLLYMGAEFIPQPLQMPPALMRVLSLPGGEPLSQIQYDVVFHFQFFDPPRGSTETFRGHNLMPWSGNGQWYSVKSKDGVDGSKPAGANQATTPYQYGDLTDLFQII